MRTIIRIEHVEEKTDKQGKTYWLTYAIVDDGTECIGWGKDFDLGDKVEAFFHYGQCKMRKPVDK